MSKKLTINGLLPISLKKELLPKNTDSENATYVGIDFGTSTTVVSLAYFQETSLTVESKTIELNQKLSDGAIYKSYKIPTMIGWYNNKLLVGEGVNRLKLQLKQGKNLWHSFKMELGEDIGCKYPYSELNNTQKINILNPKDATTIFFKYIKVQIEKYVKENDLPETIKYAISIPASFEANQRRDLLESLTINGIVLDKQTLIDEPNAAFLSYISNPKLKTEIVLLEDTPTDVLVFDFGAGTCDVSILEIGTNAKGFFSKNLSISRFEALGGNDVDKLIAIDVLLPQFLEENHLDKVQLKTKELTQIIIPRLEKVAELLKIAMSDKLSLMSDQVDISTLIANDDGVELNHNTSFNTRQGVYSLQFPKLSYKDFYQINSIFTQEYTEENEFRLNNELEFKSVFTPIFSALDKANLSKYDIDYILFIGGSSKNILIRDAISNYFDESEPLVPKDLQAHVSSGAALHSFIYNKFGKSIIEPITSEPIMVIINDNDRETVRTIIGAGTVIPCESVIVDNLRPLVQGQKTIEIPLCVGNKNKILQSIKIDSRNKSGFDLNTVIKLDVKINADKMLIVTGSIGGHPIEVQPVNPFVNQEMSIKEKSIFEAEKKFNLACARNDGEASYEILNELYEDYSNLQSELKAAETLEQIYDLFNSGNLNNIGLHYSNSGDEEKAMMFYKKAMDENPSSVTAFNIALQYKYKDNKLYRHWLEKSLEIDNSNNTTLYCLGKIYVNEDNSQKGNRMIQKAFDSWKKQYKKGRLKARSWFVSCATYLGEYDLVDELENNEEDSNYENYDLNNLTTIANNNLIGE